jgi:hypothetical protein
MPRDGRRLIRAHVLAAERIHADETTVKVQAKGQCRTGRLWTYVRDDRPFGGADPTKPQRERESGREWILLRDSAWARLRVGMIIENSILALD